MGAVRSCSFGPMAELPVIAATVGSGKKSNELGEYKGEQALVTRADA